MCDGYSGYNKVPDAKRTACWAHIRRYLTDAIPKGKELDYSQPSVQGIMYINQLFHMEEVIKAKQTSFDAIKKARLEKEKPIVEGFCRGLINRTLYADPEWIKQLPISKTAAPILQLTLKMADVAFPITLVKTLFAHLL